ncbi:unnamed protein product, partial [Soboliphyme baturini]|uniref:Thyroglobulin type-1 domain-containing protein n=1 Tax=Soboliphyme baturini TaxID=241478 RepID=A0A183IK85_9BILA
AECNNGRPNVQIAPTEFANILHSQDSRISEPLCPRDFPSGQVECLSNCHGDEDCEGGEKCCFNGCAQVCTALNAQGRACRVLRKAVDLLPFGTMIDGYVPECDASGAFKSRQCDQHHCWCVDPEGREIHGTKVTASHPIDCVTPQRHDCRHNQICNASACVYGLKTDDNGCPLSGCPCRNLCDGIQCVNTFETCQSVSKDCVSASSTSCLKRHLTSPLGLINPCQSGRPAKQPISEVVIFCDSTTDCGDEHWCFEIGYFGKGLCCEFPSCIQMQEAMRQFTYSEYVPKCVANGDFDSVQCSTDGLKCWCVDQIGHEVPGTRISVSTGHPNCAFPRICVQTSCDIPFCPYGFQMDDSGCPLCECKNPCKRMKCKRSFEVCVMEKINCGSNSCSGIPRCILNACPQGTPLVEPSTFVVSKCMNDESCLAIRGYCKLYGQPEGNSFVGSTKPGFCPLSNVVLQQVCDRSCVSDSDCSGPTKCCKVGCSYRCVEPNTSLPVIKDQKYGLCPFLTDVSQRSCIASRPSSQCSTDFDCPGIKKCCSDGCTNVCLYAQVTSGCLHQRAAIETILSSSGTLPQNQLFVPECDKDGKFTNVQCNVQRCWCVDERGVEIPGTRKPSGSDPDCYHPRICARLNCQMQCPFGVTLDDDGCQICKCHDPCHVNIRKLKLRCSICLQVIKCPYEFQICRLVQVECLLEPCLPVPKCKNTIICSNKKHLLEGLLNTCPKGEPFRDPTSWLAVKCDPKVYESCPPNHFCHLAGYQSYLGDCCSLQGNDNSTFFSSPLCNGFRSPQIGTQRLIKQDGTCPVFQAASTDKKLCTIECRSDYDCAGNGKCCFNGCGMSCIYNEALTNRILNKIGQCPKPLTIHLKKPQSSCSSSCASDQDCAGSQKCCKSSCGAQCAYPEIATGCLHQRATFELLKDESPYNQLDLPTCDIDGMFEAIQCNKNHCFCVNEKGWEVPGTRTELRRAPPNCRQPRSCPKWSCSKECLAGYTLNDDGCPLCECTDPCGKIRCGRSSDVCVAAKLSCTDDCPPLPLCIANPCSTGIPLRTTESELILCNSSSHCPSPYWCHEIGLLDQGVCCPGSQVSSRTGRCPKSPYKFDDLSTDATQTCTADEHCPNATEKCCFGGNRMLCLSMDFILYSRSSLNSATVFSRFFHE